jgi:hypothetical protein
MASVKFTATVCETKAPLARSVTTAVISESSAIGRNLGAAQNRKIQADDRGGACAIARNCRRNSEYSPFESDCVPWDLKL